MSYQEAMEAAGAVVHDYESFGSYQGDWLAHVTWNGITGIVAGGYGSCSGCDSFEAEFGWSYDGNCAAHHYEDQPLDCDACVESNARRQRKLVKFGEAYLDAIMTQTELERYVEQMTDQATWDSDAPAILRWISAHAEGE